MDGFSLRFLSELCLILTIRRLLSPNSTRTFGIPVVKTAQFWSLQRILTRFLKLWETRASRSFATYCRPSRVS